MAETITEDTLLGGRLRLRQPAAGYRAAIDPVFLAAAVAAGPGDRVLDLGAGVGAAALCLAWREPTCRVVGLEMQRPLVRLASENVALNRLTGRVEVVLGDVVNPPPRLAPGSFAQVMANPPHLEARRAASPPHPGKAAAHVEGPADLAAWVRLSLTMLREKGTITLIHRADRLDAALALLYGKVGEIVVFPLWPDAGRLPARRVLVRGRKNVRAPMRLARGLVLHEADGAYTPEAEAILREGAPLSL